MLSTLSYYEDALGKHFYPADGQSCSSFSRNHWKQWRTAHPLHSARKAARSPESECPLSSQPWTRSATALSAPRNSGRTFHAFPSTLPPFLPHAVQWSAAALWARETKPRSLRTDGGDGPVGISVSVRGKTSLRSLRNDSTRPPRSARWLRGTQRMETRARPQRAAPSLSAPGTPPPAPFHRATRGEAAQQLGPRPSALPEPRSGASPQVAPVGPSAWSGPRPHPTAGAEGSGAAWPRPRGGGSASPGPAGAGRRGGGGLLHPFLPQRPSRPRRWPRVGRAAAAAPVSASGKRRRRHRKHGGPARDARGGRAATIESPRRPRLEIPTIEF